MDSIASGITINDVRDTQSRNTSEGNSVIVKSDGMLADINDVQPEKMAFFITLIVLGNIIDFSDVQPKKTEPSSCVIFDISVTLSKLTHPAKAP